MLRLLQLEPARFVAAGFRVMRSREAVIPCAS